MVKNRGQASFEFLILLAATLLVLTATIAVAIQSINSINAQNNQDDATNAVMDLGSAAKDVYAQGTGAKKDVYIVIPASYDPAASFVGNQAIKMSAGSDYVDVENFPMRGSLPSTPGPQWVWVVSEGNDVLIGNGMLAFNTTQIYVVMNSNGSASASFSVMNTWVNATNVTASPVWSGGGVTMSEVPQEPSQFFLNPQASQTVTLNFASGYNSSGFYSGGINFTATDAAGNTETDGMPITVEVLPSSLPLNLSCNPGGPIEGPIVTDISQSPSPVQPYGNLTIFVTAADNSNRTISGCQILADNQSSSVTFNTSSENVAFNQYYPNGFAPGNHTVVVDCNDSNGTIGPLSYYYFTVNSSDLGPIVIQMTMPTSSTSLVFGGLATDAYTGGYDVQACDVRVGASGMWNAASASGGSWGTSITQNFSYTSPPLQPGSYIISYKCEDSTGVWGGIYNDTFGVVSVNLMFILDHSGSMADNVTNFVDSATNSTNSTSWAAVTNMSVTDSNGNPANLSVEFKSSQANCTASYNVTVNGTQLATGSTASTSYVTQNTNVSIGSFSVPFNVIVSLKANITHCTASTNLVSLQQEPSKMSAAASGADSFLNVVANNSNTTLAGLVSFDTTATTVQTLLQMNSSNQQILENDINGLIPATSTCIQCGLDNACAELNSSRANATASKVAVLLTDGQSNVGDSVTGAEYCRSIGVTVYTIGFGSDANATELTDVALLTNGQYYFAPDVATLDYIFQNIGVH
jgi:hypothetical protein